MAEGKFIVFEGIDGSGLTTQAEMLRNWCGRKIGEVYLTKEPSDGPAGAMIRLALGKRLVHQGGNGQFEGLHGEVLAALFLADRLDHLYSDVIPKLNLGITVIGDRYYLSTYAYQSLDTDLRWLRQLNSKCRKPDLIIFLDVPVEISKKRMERQRWHVELFEETEKLERVRKNYLDVIKELTVDGERIVIIDGNRESRQVHREVVQVVNSYVFHSSGASTRKKMTNDSQQILPLDVGLSSEQSSLVAR